MCRKVGVKIKFISSKTITLSENSLSHIEMCAERFWTHNGGGKKYMFNFCFETQVCLMCVTCLDVGTAASLC